MLCISFFATTSRGYVTLYQVIKLTPPYRLFAAFRFHFYFNRDGSFSLAQDTGIETYDIAHINRRDKLDFVHRTGDKISRGLSRSGNRASQIDMAQNHSAENRAARVGITWEHGHSQCGFSN